MIDVLNVVKLFKLIYHLDEGSHLVFRESNSILGHHFNFGFKEGDALIFKILAHGRESFGGGVNFVHVLFRGEILGFGFQAVFHHSIFIERDSLFYDYHTLIVKLIAHAAGLTHLPAAL